jgi:hypothetical protein
MAWDALPLYNCGVRNAAAGKQWTTAGLFLDALTRRDFPSLAACLDPRIRFRALVPRGPFELTDARATAAWFREVFGDKEIFEVQDAAIGQIGGRAYLRWRVRTGDTEVVEQHVFATGADRIASLDLMCSGFQDVGGCAVTTKGGRDA